MTERTDIPARHTIDESLALCWGDSRAEAALSLYGAQFLHDLAKPVEVAVSRRFLQELHRLSAALPETSEERFRLGCIACRRVLKLLRLRPAELLSGGDANISALLEAALRPVSVFSTLELADELCEWLYEVVWGRSAFQLSRPQSWVIHKALSHALAQVQPAMLEPFWRRLAGGDPSMKQAMRLGVEFLRAEHAVPQLLAGLQITQDHDVRATIVDCLELVCDPRTLLPLAELRKATAATDWTLSRHIIRVMQVIETQTRESSQQSLLRPTEAVLVDEKTLLRPAADTDALSEEHLKTDRKILVRPVLPPEDSPPD